MKLYGVTEIDINKIDIDNSFFARLGGQDREDLKESIIRMGGIVEPIVVVPKEDGRYSIVDGRNRLEIYKELEKTTIPAIIREFDSEEVKLKAEVDVELNRRHLDKVEREELKNKLNNEVVERARRIQQEVYNRYIANIKDKELKKALYDIFQKTGDTLIVKTVSKLPEEEQRKLIKEKIIAEDKEFKKIIQDKEKQLKKLEEEKAEIQARMRKYMTKSFELDELKEKYRDLKKSVKEEFENVISQKEEEIRQKYIGQEEEKIRKVVEFERAKVKEKYEKELQELAQHLRDQSRANQELKRKWENYSEELQRLEEKKKLLEKEKEKYMDELKWTRLMLKKFTQTDTLIDKLNTILKDLKSLSDACNSMKGFMTIEKQEILKTTKQISDVIKDLEGALQ